MTGPGTALVEWLARAPLDDQERAARLELLQVFEANRRILEAHEDAGEALEALGVALRAEDQDAAGGYHSETFLDGYRVGYGHAQSRCALWVQHLARALAFAKREGA